MKKCILIAHPCPRCGTEGGVYAVKNKKDGALWAYCDECDTLWETIDNIQNEVYFNNRSAEFEWGGYATLEEVKEFGWGKYIIED